MHSDSVVTKEIITQMAERLPVYATRSFTKANMTQYIHEQPCEQISHLPQPSLEKTFRLQMWGQIKSIHEQDGLSIRISE